MFMMGCNNRCNCTGLAVLASLVAGVVAAFLRITAVITVTPAFLWAVLGAAVVYLAVLLAAATGRIAGDPCEALSLILIGLVGTILLATVLLAIPFAATSVIGAILTGALIAFAGLVVTAAACYVRHRSGVKND